MREVKFAFIFLLLILNFFVVSAEHQASPSSFSVTANQTSSYTITVTNTEVEDALTSSNITQVSITLPANLIFIENTNSTNALAVFTNTSTVLTWTNSTYLIGSSNGGENVKTFTFVANATTIGSANIVLSTTNISGTFQRNIGLTVSAPGDSTNPESTLLSPDNNYEDTDGTIVFECNSSDNIGVDAIVLYVWNSDNTELYKNMINTNGLSNKSSWDYTFSADGDYKWNCLVNDTSNNKDWASNRTIKISLAPLCSTNWTCSEWNSCINRTQTRTCTDANSCGTNVGKPSLNQSCCIQKWECTDWLPEKCPKNETQTRTCTDANSCGNSTGKPNENKICSSSFSILDFLKIESTGNIIFIIAVVVILTGVLVVILLIRKRILNKGF